MARQKLRQTDERNQAIVEEFNKVNAKIRSDFGELASSVSMKARYIMVADKFYLHYKTVSNIIARTTKANASASQRRKIPSIPSGE